MVRGGDPGTGPENLPLGLNYEIETDELLAALNTRRFHTASVETGDKPFSSYSNA